MTDVTGVAGLSPAALSAVTLMKYWLPFSASVSRKLGPEVVNSLAPTSDELYPR
jgi:hypothetical protein